MVENMVGDTDRPQKKRADDAFGVEKYIRGLEGFIQDCSTPMTIAIQGDWGSGKTSFMYMIQDEIDDSIVSVWFNTWQFSQFNLGDSLPLMLMQRLIDAFDVKGEKGDKVKHMLTKLGEAVVHVSLSAANSMTGMDVSGAVKKFREEPENESIAEVISKLKDQFQDCVNQCLIQKGKKKAVIFVDDLDRLQPAKAVELLEVLKLFLDCDNCVFVLAIDYEVVLQGIRQKYGETIGNEKGRSFFDKIIQVPFKMPVAHYNIEKYVRSSLEKMDLSVQDEKPYVDLIHASIGYNPRGMKRLMNAFLLLQRIHSDEDLNQEYDKRLLFAVLCLQLSFEKIYNFVVVKGNEITPNFFIQLSNPSLLQQYVDEDESETEIDDTLEELLTELEIDEKSDLNQITGFMGSFCNALADNGALSEKHIQRLHKILSFSAVTASPSAVDNGKVGRAIRHACNYNTEVCYYNIDEPITKSNKPNGWNKCKLEGYRLFGEDIQIPSFSKAMQDILQRLYQKDPSRLLEAQQQAEINGLHMLFKGSGMSGLQTPMNIPGTNIKFETKTNYNQKVSSLRTLMQVMGYKPDDLQLKARLAIWKQVENFGENMKEQQ